MDRYSVLCRDNDYDEPFDICVSHVEDDMEKNLAIKYVCIPHSLIVLRNIKNTFTQTQGQSVSPLACLATCSIVDLLRIDGLCVGPLVSISIALTVMTCTTYKMRNIFARFIQQDKSVPPEVARVFDQILQVQEWVSMPKHWKVETHDEEK